uniref:Protein tyrosine phosphatase 4A2b n=1 Tax=Dicentrarchus labrax TaxID=13489 RepID=A0A8C4HKX3_DICLA
MGRLANMNRPAAVEIAYECMRFLITHNPTNATLNKFTEELKKFHVNTLVRVCDATYDKAPVEKEGIHVVDWPFDDGAPPPTQIVDDWLKLLNTKFREEPGCCIAVHCVAGLGRVRKKATQGNALSALRFDPPSGCAHSAPAGKQRTCAPLLISQACFPELQSWWP